MRGRFVVLEGIDGSGKTTLARGLAGLVPDAWVTSEPTDGPLGSVLRFGSLGDIPPAAEALLFAADRAVHTEQTAKVLSEGRWVICDRYLASTAAYQAAAMGEAADREWLVSMQKHSVTEPDLTILLDMDPEESLGRAAGRGLERGRFEKLGYLRAVREEYLRLASEMGFEIIDASKGRDEVLARAVELLKQKGIYASERRDLRREEQQA